MSIWICKWVSWWCHRLTLIFVLLKHVKACPHIKIYQSKHYSAFIHSGYKASFISLYNYQDKNICIIMIHCFILASYLHALLICVLLKNEIKLNWKFYSLIAEIWDFCHFFEQNLWKIVRRWHQLTQLHIFILTVQEIFHWKVWKIKI